MPFEKGKPKTGGRAKGTPNTVTRDLHELIREVVESSAEQMKQDLAAMEPRDRVNALIKLAEFVAPKLQRLAVTAEFVTPESMEQTVINIAFRPPEG